MEGTMTVREYLSDRNNKCTWKMERLSTALLKSRQPYQRKIDISFIEDKIKEFDWNKVQPVHVSYRDGKYYVLDGQHTILIVEGYNQGKPTDVICIVHKGMTYTDEAKYYAEQYDNIHRQSYNQLTVAKFQAGMTDICELAEKMRSVGARMSYDNSTTKGIPINAAKTVINTYRKYPEYTVKAVECIVTAYKDRIRCLSGEMIAGVTEFIRLYHNNIVYDKLMEALSITSPDILRSNARNLKMSYPVNWTETLRDQYNKKSGRKKLKYISEV